MNGGFMERLTEGIETYDVAKKGAAVLKKWDKTGLLRDLDNHTKKSMACLLENQAREILREASTMEAGNIEGFAAVAFPIVRRVFASLLANDIVSVQPMSLPAGLIFFLDFTVDRNRVGFVDGQSIYGGNVVGLGLTGGVNLNDPHQERSMYNLNQGYSSPTGSAAFTFYSSIQTSGTVGGTWVGSAADANVDGTYQDEGDRLVRFDPDLSGTKCAVGSITKSTFTNLSDDNLVSIELHQLGDAGRHIRRLTQIDPLDSTKVLFVVAATGSESTDNLSASMLSVVSASFVVEDVWSAGSGNGSIVGASAWGLENEPNIPQIDIKVNSIAVTAETKKLKAVWTPELGQDLQAFHNLDAEVELTKIMSEHVSLEIDRSILEDLIKGAKAGTYYWSRMPGNFVHPTTGRSYTATNYPDFVGNVSEWYQTLLETVNDLSAAIYRKTLRGGANFIVTSPEVGSILEMTAGFQANINIAETDKGDAGTIKLGSVGKKWEVYIDPYFPRNVMLVGRKGNSFLESGYVYAPYVPLQMTPTIFDPDTFVPRKGLLTRFAKEMVRPDFYGLVVVRHLRGDGS